MPRIITVESNKRLKREYRVRFLTILIVLVSLVLGLVTLLMIPQYVLLRSYESAYANSQNDGGQEAFEKLNQEYATELQTTYLLARKINRTTPMHMQVGDILFGYAGDGVSFDSIELVDNGETISISVRGIAKDRASLLSFDDRVQADKKFSGFDLPIEVLTKQFDIAFNVTFTYHEE